MVDVSLSMAASSATPVEKARNAHSRVLQAMQNPGTGSALAVSMGVSDSTVSRLKTEHLEQVLVLLYQLGFKLVIRRERSFDGIEYKIQEVEANTQAAEDVSTAMRLVVEFDDAKKAAVNALKDDMDAQGATIAAAGGGGSMGSVDSSTAGRSGCGSSQSIHVHVEL